MSAREHSFSCRADETERMLDELLAFIGKAITDVTDEIARKGRQSPNTEEFRHFRREALSYMQTPPRVEGGRLIYFSGNGWCYPRQDEMSAPERQCAIRAVQAVLLYDPTDITTRLCLGLLLLETAAREGSSVATDERWRLGLALIADAQAEQNDYNTRAIYGWAFHRCPDQAEKLRMARYVVDSATRETWPESYVASCRKFLLKHDTWTAGWRELAVDARTKREKDDFPRHFYNQFRALCQGHHQTASKREILHSALQKIAMGDDSFLKACALEQLCDLARKEKQFEEFQQSFLRLADLMPDVYAEFGKHLRSTNLLHYFMGHIPTTPELMERYFPDADHVELLVCITNDILRTKEPAIAGGLSGIIRSLPSVLFAAECFEEGEELLERFLACYSVGGGGDYDSMNSIIWLNRFRRYLQQGEKEWLRPQELQIVALDEHVGKGVWRLVSDNKRIAGLFGRDGFSASSHVFLWEGNECRVLGSEDTNPWQITDLALHDNKLLLTTRNKGLVIHDLSTGEMRSMGATNSAFPTDRLLRICTGPDSFYVGAADQQNLFMRFYEVDLNRDAIRLIGRSGYTTMRHRFVYAAGKTPPVHEQEWGKRVLPIDAETWVFHCQYNDKADNVLIASRMFTDGRREIIFRCRSLDLSYVEKVFPLGERLLIVAHNGLYLLDVQRSELRCVLFNQGLYLNDALIHESALYLGTTSGLQIIKLSALDEAWGTAVHCKCSFLPGEDATGMAE